jgi:uncharacterized protein (DUF2147 family)
MAPPGRPSQNGPMKRIALVLACLAVAACSPKAEPRSNASAESATVSAASEVASSTVASAVADIGYVGKWTGPEGTWLDIEPQGEDYRVTISNLDGPRDFDGKAEEGGIRFTRDGRTFVIRPGNGEATGMKWLAGKKDCLIVASGEGYCRS